MLSGLMSVLWAISQPNMEHTVLADYWRSSDRLAFVQVRVYSRDHGNAGACGSSNTGHEAQTDDIYG